MKKYIDFLKRNLVWIALGALACLLIGPGMAEIRTLLFIALSESLALGLSGLAAYAYTQIDFTGSKDTSVLGQIFLGVHVCVGLIVMGVYLAQFA